MNAKEELEVLVTKGPASDIFLAEEARAVAQVIDGARGEISRSTFGRAFDALKGYAIERFILAATRMFETPKGYALQSLPAVLLFLERNAATLPIVEPVLFRHPLKRLGVWSPAFEPLADYELTTAILRELRSRMPTPDSNEALSYLKKIRDKFLAHREHIEIESILTTTWASTDDMFHFAKCVVSAIGGGYLSTGYMFDDGSYGLSSDAQMTSSAVQRLIGQLPGLKRD